MILTLIFDNFSKMCEFIYFFYINATIKRTKNNTFVIADNFCWSFYKDMSFFKRKKTKCQEFITWYTCSLKKLVFALNMYIAKNKYIKCIFKEQMNSRKYKCEFMGWRFEAEICNKATGEKARPRQRSRGHFLCGTGGGHITYFDPIFKWENRLLLIYNQTILKQSSHLFYNEIIFVFTMFN